MNRMQTKCDFMLNVVKTATLEGISLEEFQKLAIAAYGVLQPTLETVPALLPAQHCPHGVIEGDSCDSCALDGKRFFRQV